MNAAEGPASLSDATIAEILAAAEQIRQEADDQQVSVHGWQFSWTIRRKSSGGDFVAVDPAGGRRIYSLRALRVRLGVASETDLEYEDSDRKAHLHKQAAEADGLLLPEGTSRTRHKPLSYVEQPKRRVGDTIVHELEKVGALASTVND